MLLTRHGNFIAIYGVVVVDAAIGITDPMTNNLMSVQ
jgi:hypothetical protein